MKYEIIKYITKDGKEPYGNWIKTIRDPLTRARIEKGILKVENGSFGDHENLGGGVWELKFHFGKGYRVYYGKEGNRIIVLLCAGDKSKQNKDILKAKEFWKDYLEDKNG